MDNTKIIRFCDNYKYNFVASPDKLKFEVETDVRSLKTDNFFIEFNDYGKPSGITITKSNFYILSDTIIYYLIETNKLKTLIENFTFTIVPTSD